MIKLLPFLHLDKLQMVFLLSVDILPLFPIGKELAFEDEQTPGHH